LVVGFGFVPRRGLEHLPAEVADALEYSTSTAAKHLREAVVMAAFCRLHPYEKLLARRQTPHMWRLFHL